MRREMDARANFFGSARACARSYCLVRAAAGICVSWYTHFVPLIPLVWRLGVGGSASGKRGALREGSCERGAADPTARDVPAMPYCPSQPRIL